MPLQGVLPAKFEDRWCYDCQAITAVFTGEGEIVDLPKRAKFQYVDASGLRCNYIEIEELKILYKDLNARMRWSLLARLNLSNRKRLLIMTNAISSFESEYNRVLEQNLRVTQFYSSKGLPAVCSSCSSGNVGRTRWVSHQHDCGGRFVFSDRDLVFTQFSHSEEWRYDSQGRILEKVHVPL